MSNRLILELLQELRKRLRSEVVGIFREPRRRPPPRVTPDPCLTEGGSLVRSPPNSGGLPISYRSCQRSTRSVERTT